MKIKIIKFFSNALSPPVIAIAVTIAFSLFSSSFLLSAGFGILFLGLLPIASVIYFYKRGLVDIEVSDRKSRTGFFIAAIFSYAAAAAIFYLLGFHEMFAISAAYFFVTSAVALVNLFWKISIHAAGVAGPTTALVFVFGSWLSPLYILTAAVFYARLKLNAHTLAQLAGGAFVGIVVTFVTYWFLY